MAERRGTTIRTSAPAGGPGPAGRRERQRARTRARLVDAATRLIADRGLGGVAMSDVTSEADLGTGTIYNHFPTFDGLVEAVVAEALETEGAQLDALTADVEDPAEVFAASLRHLVLHATSDPLWGRLLVRLGVSHPQLMKVLGPRAARDLRAGIRSGRFDIRDLDVVTACTFGSLTGVLQLVVGRAGEEGAADVAGAEVATTYAVSMLQMVGVPASEAHEVARRPLPSFP